MTRDDKLSSDVVDAAELAIAEHLRTLRLDTPAQEIEMMHPKTGEVVMVPNPLWIKVMSLKSRAASDVLNIMRNVDPQSMKGRKTDRTAAILERITKWKQAGGTA